MILTNKIFSCTLLTVLCCAVASCNSDSDSSYDVTDYTDALVTAFSVSDNDSVCYSLSSYTFSIDQYGHSDAESISDDPGAGIIFNADSLPYGSVPDSLVVSLSYSSPTAVYFYQYDAEGNLANRVNFADTTWIDFAHYAKTRLEVTALDGVSTKSYIVKVNVHQIEGDTIRWEYKAENLFETADVTAQRVDTIGRNLYWFVEHGAATQVVQSAPLGGDVTIWSTPQTLDAPALLDLSTLHAWRNVLYAVSVDGKLLAATDALHWSEASTAYEFVNILGVTLAAKQSVDSLRAIVKVSDAYHFAASADGRSWTQGGVLPAEFPISGYTAPISVAAKPSLGTVTSRLYIVGGRTAGGQLTSSTWTCDGKTWQDFRQNTLLPMAGASLVNYTLDTDYPHTFWLLYPGETATGIDNTLYFSENSGVTWKKMSREYSAYADNSMIAPVAYHTAFVDPKTYWMYFIGGRDADGDAVANIVAGQLLKLTYLKQR